MAFARHSWIPVTALLSSLLTTSAGATCPDCHDERCFLGECVCVRKIGCVISILPPTPTPGSPLPSPIPLPEPIQTEIDKLGRNVPRTVVKLGRDTLATFGKAGDDTVRALQTAGGDTFATIQKAGDDSVTTIYKGAGDATATYVKAWRDTGNQAAESFNDAIDAGKAAYNFVKNQWEARKTQADNARSDCAKGKSLTPYGA